MGFKSSVLADFVVTSGDRPFTGAQSLGGNNLTNTGRIEQTPTAFSWTAGAASISVAVKNDFVSSDSLTQNSTLTLTDGTDGCQGTIYVKQDATGGWTLDFVVAGRTILREDGAADSNPKTDPDSLTGYVYDFKTVAGTAYVIISRLMLS